MMVSKMSERQTKAGNQEFQSLNFIENCGKTWKNLPTKALSNKSFSKEGALTKLLLDIVKQ